MATAPRNRLASEQGKDIRQEIRVILERRPNIAPPLTARQIIPQLSRPLSERAVQWHVREIQQETLRLPQFIHISN